MLITIDIKNELMKDKFLNFIKTLDYIEIKDTDDLQIKSNNPKKNKFSEFVGLWDESVTIDNIKEKAWKR